MKRLRRQSIRRERLVARFSTRPVIHCTGRPSAIVKAQTSHVWRATACDRYKGSPGLQRRKGSFLDENGYFRKCRECAKRRRSGVPRPLRPKTGSNGGFVYIPKSFMALLYRRTSDAGRHLVAANNASCPFVPAGCRISRRHLILPQAWIPKASPAFGIFVTDSG